MALPVEPFGDSLEVGTIGVSRHGRTTLLVLTGPFDDFDAAALTALAQAELAVAEPRVIVDASGITFLGDEFLDALVALEDLCRQRRGSLRITGAPPAMCRLCRLADLDRLIEAGA